MTASARIIPPVYHVALIASHVIQYQAPFFRLLAAEPELDLEVIFCSTDGAEVYRDAEMQTTFRWDLDLLGGYRHRFLRNFGFGEGYTRLINPGIVPALLFRRYDAAIFFLGWGTISVAPRHRRLPHARDAGADVRRQQLPAAGDDVRVAHPRRLAADDLPAHRRAFSSAACSTPTTTATTAPTRARFHPRAVGHRQRALRGSAAASRRASARRCARASASATISWPSSSPRSSCRARIR